MSKTIAAAVLSAALLAVPVSGLASGAEREPASEAGNDEIGKPLSEVAAGKLDPKTLRVEVLWVEGAKQVPARFFGNGVAIWDNRLQGQLSRAEVLSVVNALKDARFGAMPSRIGEGGDKLKLRGKMAVSIAGKTKGVVQLAEGDQSKAFSALGTMVLQLVEKRAKTGVTASSLADALGKLSTGALAPEALRLSAIRRPDKPESVRGWLLQVEGRQAVARPYGRQGFGNEKRLELSDADARSLIGAVRESHPESLPSSLFAPDYTEVRIDALQWTSDHLARQSAGVTRETHGEKQKSFDRLVEYLTRLEDRVEKEGKESPGAAR